MANDFNKCFSSTTVLLGQILMETLLSMAVLAALMRGSGPMMEIRLPPLDVNWRSIRVLVVRPVALVCLQEMALPV